MAKSIVLPDHTAGGDRAGHLAIVYGTAILTVALVAFVAAYIPARRAANLDPMAALRME